MKIVKFELWVLERGQNFFDSTRTVGAAMPWDVVLIQLTADNGCVGIASALGARSGRLTAQYLTDIVAPVVVGRDAHDREAIWHDLWTIDRHLTFFPVFLPGPVDVALWDLAARAAEVPLYKYLGSCRSSLPVYASSLFLGSTTEYVDQALRYRDRGFPAYKAHPPGGWRRDREVHHALRDALGPDYVLMSDPVAEYTLEDAIRVGRDLEALDYHWFEEPFRDFELQKYQRLCAALDIPVAATETTRGAHWGVAQAINFGAIDIVRADVSWKAGITGTMKIAHLAEAYGLQCEIHTTTMGPMDIANLHVSCAIRNCEYFELFVPEDSFRFPMRDPYPIDETGWIHAPDKPGLGIEIDWNAVDNACVDHRIQEAT